MLLCLSREQRLVYVLGEIFGVTDTVGAELLEIEPRQLPAEAVARPARSSPFHARAVRPRQRGESVPVREEDAGLHAGPAISTRTSCCSPANTSRACATSPPGLHEDLEALDAAYAEIHRGHPFLEGRDFVALLRDLMQRPDFKQTLDFN